MTQVYVVDDEKSILDALEFMLLEEGYDVRTSSRGSALLQLNSNFPDIIILDVRLSGEDGRDIARRLKTQANTKHIPIVMVSAHPNAATTVYACGADDFLPKPFDIDDLLKILEKHTTKPLVH